MSNEKLLINDDKSNNFEVKSNNEIEVMIECLNNRINVERNSHFGKGRITISLIEAEDVLNALKGYRKQSEGEWIITTPIVMRVWDSDCITCSVCGGKSVCLLEDNKLKYCPHCGARMRGGAEE